MNVDRILIVNMNYLGDALMTTPAIRAIKGRYPSSRIDVIAGSTANYGALDILSLDPDIDNLIPRVNGGSFERGMQLYKVIAENNYDLIVVLPSIPFYNYIAKMTGKNVLTVPKADETKHMAEHMLDSIIKLIPDAAAPSSMVVDVPQGASISAAEMLGPLTGDRQLILFNVGASRPQKRWPIDHFTEAARLVVDSGLNVALVGGDNPKDLLAASTIMESFAGLGESFGTAVVNLVGKTTLEQLAAVIKIAAVLVTADTGAMHIASALDTPLVALFGSTSASFTGPYGTEAKTRILDLHLSCAPCGTHPTCNGRFDCMAGILPKIVFESILELISSNEGTTACQTR